MDLDKSTESSIQMSNFIDGDVLISLVEMPQYSASASLPPLQLPEENEWPVFVSMMPSVSNVFVRLADDACDDYFKMCEDLDKFMSEATRPAPVPGVEVGELYCLNDDSVWHRVRVESADEQIVVKMIDHGEEGPRAIQELYPLYDMFRTIPAQAIELYLPECQVFAEHFDHSEVEREIVGKTLVAVIQSRETLTATLYNTAEDPNVNINHFIFDQICGWFNESSLPEENMFNGSVFVSFISTNENCIYVQVESLMFQYLTNSIRELITTSDVQEYVVKSTAALTDCREDIFLAKYDLDGEYYRASLLDVNPISNNVSVRFIDYGNTSLVSCTNLIKLFETSESHLCLIPAQAKEVKLVGLEHFTPDVMNKLTTYVNGTEPVMLKMTAGRAQLHKRDHDGKIVNINALVLGSPLNTSGFKGSPYKTLANYKEFDASPLEPPTIPPLNHMIDVLVETVVSPSNFWIRPQESYNKWVDLVEEMEEFYSEQDKTLKPTREHIKVGASFAFYYEELELWQRVTINSQISPECVALFLVDFGKIITANTSELQYLAPQFRKLPAIAIKSKLHDIKPAFGDWNPEDILRFQQMCDPIKVFKCRIENCTPDLISHKEDVQLSVRLLDTHHSDVDLDLSVVLVVEGRAKMND